MAIRATSPRSKAFWVWAGLLLAGGVAMSLVVNLSGDPSSQTSPIDPTPGITRVGADRAAKLWADLPETHGMQRWSCDGNLCYVMFDPSAWSQMEYDLKRSFTTAMGIALSYGKQARWTEIRDMMTGRELATYTTDSDGVRFK